MSLKHAEPRAHPRLAVGPDAHDGREGIPGTASRGNAAESRTDRHDELMLDGNADEPRDVVTTWMDPQPAAHDRVLRQEHDRQGRVPADAELESRCVEILSASGTPDAARPPAAPRRIERGGMLGGLAMKRAGSSGEPRGQAGRPPELSWINVQSLEKFANYWDSRCVWCPWTASASTSPPRSREALHENTIGVVAILGRRSTAPTAGRGDLRGPRRLQARNRARHPVTRRASARSSRLSSTATRVGLRLPRVTSINARPQVRLVYPASAGIVWRDATRCRRPDLWSTTSGQHGRPSR